MNGILILNKEKGYTSHDLVNKVKKISLEKVGHTGTLDPMATGVLPLLIGEATKLSKYLMEHDKEYEVVLQLGCKTDTADSEGKIIERKAVPSEILKREIVEKVLQNFLGKQKQMPPMYSAIKVKGKKLYEYARQGKIVKVAEREIEIIQIELIEIDQKEQTISFWVHCSKGTYIRSLCEDIAAKLQTVGYMKELNRTRVGQFSIENAISLTQMEKHEMAIERHLLTIEEFLKDKETITLNEKRLTLLINGVLLNVQRPDGIYCIDNEKHQFIGTAVCKNQQLKRDIILFH